MQPVDDVATLVGGDELVHDHLARRLDIGTVAADHAVETDSFELGRHLGLAAARAHISQVPIGAGGPDGRHAGRRNVALIVGDRAIDIEEQDFTVGHGRSLSGLTPLVKPTSARSQLARQGAVKRDGIGLLPMPSKLNGRLPARWLRSVDRSGVR